jgi:protein-S-isoprenylcysteine O-methyltransferase Ste14
MSLDAAHARSWETFEVVFGIPFILAIALQFLLPLSFPDGLARVLFALAGAALIIIGIALVVLARRELRSRGQPTDPGLPTTGLVTTGVFSVSRNPLYLGGVCVLAGIALAANLPWVILLLIPATAAAYYLLIAPEERYLAAKFGQSYRRYTSSVHRWIGRARTSQ